MVPGVRSRTLPTAPRFRPTPILQRTERRATYRDAFSPQPPRSESIVCFRDFMRRTSPILFAAGLIVAAAVILAQSSAPRVNSIGISLVRIAPGAFDMGVDSTPLPKELITGVSGVTYDRTSDAGDYDE